MRSNLHSLFRCINLLILLPACSEKPIDSVSQLTWGHLGNVSNGFITMAPDSSISVCGDNAEVAASGIEKWAAAIGRDAKLKIDGSCNQSADRVIKVQSGAGTSNCGAGAAAYTDTVKNVYVCQSYSGDMLTHVLMHELGHIWGMCDQYSNGAGCDSQNSGGVQPQTIMGAASGLTELTDDDIEGIKALAARTDLQNADLWTGTSSSKSSSSSKNKSTSSSSSSNKNKGTKSSTSSTSAPTMPNSNNVSPNTSTNMPPGNYMYVDQYGNTYPANNSVGTTGQMQGGSSMCYMGGDGMMYCN